MILEEEFIVKHLEDCSRHGYVTPKPVCPNCEIPTPPTNEPSWEKALSDLSQNCEVPQDIDDEDLKGDVYIRGWFDAFTSIEPFLHQTIAREREANDKKWLTRRDEEMRANIERLKSWKLGEKPCDHKEGRYFNQGYDEAIDEEITFYQSQLGEKGV
jgi:hypothetical protein